MQYRQKVTRNAERISMLRQRIRETLVFRDSGLEQKSEWRQACAAFHDEYDELAFPGGPRTARHRMRAGNEEAIEYAIAFLEVRPYFFRPGYMYNEFMRVLRNCPLSKSQQTRYDLIRSKYITYRTNRQRFP